jgi:HlyD family secretion protein
MKKWIVRVLLAALLAAGGYAGFAAFREMMAEKQRSVPTAKVRKGDVVVRSFARGELRAVRSVTLTAPNLFGTVQVTKLAALGAFAREKDLVVEFDDAEVLSRLEERQLELDQVDEQIKKAQADLAIRSNQDEVELLRARYAVRRAELEVRRNELISAIDAKKNELTLEETKRRLVQLESDIKSRREQAQAELAVLRERRNKANIEMNRERARLMQVKLLAPISGLVAIKQNRSGMMMFGMQAPDIREGDQVQPGMQVADILDLSEMEVIAKVGELDRANLREGQQVTMRLDAIADKTFTGEIKSMSGTAAANMFSSDPAKKFDVVFSIDMKQLLSALGAKPDYIAKVLATAEANRKRPPTQSASGGFLGGGGGFQMAAMAGPAGGPSPGGAGVPAAMSMPFAGGGIPGGPPAGAGGFRPAGAGGGGGGLAGGMFAGLNEEQQKKARAALMKALDGKSMQELLPDERQEVFTRLRKELEAQGIKMPDRNAAGGGRGPGAAGGMSMPFAGGGIPGGFSQRDFENAKLPPPPEEDSQFDVLLRPGLLADVEITVEKIPDAIHIPSQAIFEKDGKQVVYVLTKGKFEERVVQPAKRSESTMVIASGLQPDEVIALADPFAKPGDKKKQEQKGGAAMPMPKS